MADNTFYAPGQQETISKLQGPLLASIVIDGTLISSDIAQWVLNLIQTDVHNPVDDICDDTIHLKYTRTVIELFNGAMKQLREADDVSDDLLDHLIYYCDVHSDSVEQFKAETNAFLEIIRVLELIWDSEIGEIQLDPTGVFLILQNAPGAKEVPINSDLDDLDDIDEDDEDEDDINESQSERW